MEVWISEALNGNIDYFLKQNMRKDNCKQFVDQYGMTPLMYAVLGCGYRRTDIIRNFIQNSDTHMKNCLGHTAYDVFLCIADETASTEVFDLLNPFTTVRKTAKTLGSIFDFGMRLLSEWSEIPLYTDLGNDSMAFSNAIYKFKTNNETLLGSLESDLETAQVNYQNAIVAYQNAIKNEMESAKNIFEAKYSGQVEEIKRQYIEAIDKDEFETQQEYLIRAEQLFMSTHSWPILREDELEALRHYAEEEAHKQVQEAELWVQNLEKDIKHRTLCIELLRIYACPQASYTLGVYDPETNTFPVTFGRHQLSVVIPRDEARILKQNMDKCRVIYSWDHEGLQYYMQLTFELLGKEYKSNCAVCNILGYDMNVDDEGEEPYDNLNIYQLIYLMDDTTKSKKIRTECLLIAQKKLAELDDDEFSQLEKRYSRSNSKSAMMLLQQERAKRF